MKSLKEHIDEAVNREYNIPGENNLFKYKYTENAQFLVLLGLHNLYGFVTEEEIKSAYKDNNEYDKLLKLKPGEAYTIGKETYFKIK